MLKLVLPPDTNELAQLRAAVRSWADERDIPEWPLTLIVTELAANAIAVTPPDETFEVTVAAEGPAVEVRVTDPGPGFDEAGVDLDSIALPPADQPRGRGLFLVRQFATELKARRLQGRTIVSACQREPSSATGIDGHRAEPT